MIRQAMVLAAGLGTRMRPLTERTAKPLLPLGGRTLLDHALDRLAAAGVASVVVNTHWQADLVRATCPPRPRPGDRAAAGGHAAGHRRRGGGGAGRGRAGGRAVLRRQRRQLLAGRPDPALGRLHAAFDPAALDGVLLLHRTFQVHGEVGRATSRSTPGAARAGAGSGRWRPTCTPACSSPRPALFADPPAAPFSINLLWDRAIAAERLRAVVHDGLWFHLSRPQDLSDAEVALHANADRASHDEPGHDRAARPFLDALAADWLRRAGTTRWRRRTG